MLSFSCNKNSFTLSCMAVEGRIPRFGIETGFAFPLQSIRHISPPTSSRSSRCTSSSTLRIDLAKLSIFSEDPGNLCDIPALTAACSDP